jgi:hypothetical protein
VLRIYSLRDRRIGRDDWWEPVFRWGSGEHSTYQKGGGVSFASVSLNLALVRDRRDLRVLVIVKCSVLVVLCSVPVTRPVFSPRSALVYVYMCSAALEPGHSAE